MEKQRKHNFWFGFAMLLLGVVLGFLAAPVKKGVSVKNICGNTWYADELEEIDEKTESENKEEE
jgi:hypothetical protein